MTEKKIADVNTMTEDEIEEMWFRQDTEEATE